MLSRFAVNKTIKDYKKNQQENIGVLMPPKSILILGIISMVFWAALMIAVLIFAKDVTTILICALVFGSLFALGLFLVLYERNFLVIYRDGEIIYRNLFRITRKFSCRDIAHTYYTDGGGIQLVFKDGRKLSFGKEESYFSGKIVKTEHLKCQFRGEESTVIKVRLHPFIMLPLWFLSGGMALGSLFAPDLFLYAILITLVCLGCQMSNTTYDQDSKILTRRRYGFAKHYDMLLYSAKPVYRDDFLVYIELYKGNQKITKIPVSREYKNRARLAWILCGVTA